MTERREPSLHGAPADGVGGGETPVAALCAAFPAPPGATVVLFGADGHARRLAAANGIEDPLALRAGGMLSIPQLDRT